MSDDDHVERDDRRDARRPRVLITGAGERRLEALCAALEARSIEPLLIEGALDAAIRVERPNLVLLVGDAASDDGARGIDDARRAGQTPVVVTTDAEPLDRRLAPFQYGASGIVVRRDDPDEMAGEIQHLLAENARRIAETRRGRSETELDGLVGLGSNELRMSATPNEGLERPVELQLASPQTIPSWPADEVPTLEVQGRARGAAEAGAPPPDWDEDLATARQPSAEVARWRRLSASDRSALPTPEMRPALDARGEPVAVGGAAFIDAVTVERPLDELSLLPRGDRTTAQREIPEIVLARERASAPRPTDARVDADAVRDEWDVSTTKGDLDLGAERAELARARGAELPPTEAARPPSSAPAPVGTRAAFPRRALSSMPARALVVPLPVPTEAPVVRVPSRPPATMTATEPPVPAPFVEPPSIEPAGPASAPSLSIPDETSVGEAPTRDGVMGPPSDAPRSAPPISSTGERISASAMVAFSPPSRPPIDDRASTLRAQAIPRRRASVKPALIALGIMLAAVGAITGPRVVDIARTWALGERRQDGMALDVARDDARLDGADRGAPSLATGAPPAMGAPPATGAEATPAEVTTGAETATAEATSGAEAAAEVEAAPAVTGAEAEVAAAIVSDAVIPDRADAVIPDRADAVIPDRARSDALVREGQARAHAGDRAGARALLDAALTADRDNPHALIAAAVDRLRAGEAEDALRLARRAVAVRRRRAEYHVVLGDAYRLSGDQARAEEAWRAALELEPDRADARSRLAP